jgi:16S rRNA (cytidine1402-2'-O)-methyltransferase
VTGRLVLVATPIGNLGDLSPRAMEAFRDADEVWCEDTRRTRTLLSYAGIEGVRLRSVREHNESHAAEQLVEGLRAGRTIAYASDAGMPGISDPGTRLVAACVAAGLDVTIVPGPTAALSALVLSGFATERFAFEGFLERKGPERRATIDRIARSTATSIIYEAPNRVSTTISDLAAVCGADRRVVVVRELTKLHEEVVRGTLGDLDEVDVRGECVIVIEAAAPTPPADDDAIDGAIRVELAAGASARDAAAAVADALGVAKRRAYERALIIKQG